MTIEEIRHAKQQAEDRIRAELRQLAAKGMDVHSVEVQTVLCEPSGLPVRRWVDKVTIDLRMPP